MASNPQHEPTMEEILASIRKIISEDSNEAAAPAPAAPQPAPVAAKPVPVAAVVEDDVLELTHEVEEEPAPAPIAPAPVLRAAPPPKAPVDDVVFQSIEESPVSPTAQSPMHSSEGIFSDKSRKAMDDVFAALDDEHSDDKPATPVRDRMAPVAAVDGATVEAVFERAVRTSFEPVIREWADSNAEAIVDRMKPLIREWLDEHFPAMLEEAVRGEVARVVKARRR
jgi:cell pole-organizing protein PopZ